MRRLGSGGVAAALFLGLGAAIAVGGGDPKGRSAPKGIFSDMFNEKPPKSAANANTPAVNGNQPVVPRPAPMRLTEMDAAEQERQASKANMRRMEVCDRLKTIAMQTGNEALMNLAYELEDRANEIYRRKTARLPLAIQTSPSAPGAEPKTANRPTEPMAANESRR